MIIEKMCEFLIMLKIEELAQKNPTFDEYIHKYDIGKFNNRYRELLDEFLSPYALNKPEKSV